MKNTRKWLLAAALAGLAPAASGRALAQEAKTEVTEMSVSSKNTHLHLTPGQQAMAEALGMSMEASTNLRLKVSVPGKIILGAGSAAWKIDSFSDDKGTDLFAVPGQAPKADDLKKSLQISSDGKSCHFEVEAVGSLPAADASRLSLSGTIALRCGSAPSTAAQKNVALKAGTKITAGPVPLTISAVKALKPDHSFEGGFDVTLKSSQPMERLLEVAVVNAAGDDVSNTSSSGGPDSPAGANTWVLHVERMAPGMTVKVTSVAKIESVTIPLHVETGLDMGG